MSRTVCLCLALVGLALLSSSTPLQAKQDPATAKVVQRSMLTWLALVDAGKYAESWNTACDSFKKAVTKEKWTAAVKPIREPIGKVKSRKFKRSQYIKDPPNAPKGEYVMSQFDTNFDKKAGAVETVTALHDKDGKWRVGGYFIK